MGSIQTLKIFFSILAPGWIDLTLYSILKLQYLGEIWVFFKMMTIGQNLSTFCPMDKKCSNFAWRNRSWFTFRQKKNPNFVIEIVFTQYNFCWLQLLFKKGYHKSYRITKLKNKMSLQIWFKNPAITDIDGWTNFSYLGRFFGHYEKLFEGMKI